MPQCGSTASLASSSSSFFCFVFLQCDHDGRFRGCNCIRFWLYWSFSIHAYILDSVIQIPQSTSERVSNGGNLSQNLEHSWDELHNTGVERCTGKTECMCVTVLIEGQWSSPAQPPHNETAIDLLGRSEHLLQMQSEIQTHAHKTGKKMKRFQKQLHSEPFLVKCCHLQVKAKHWLVKRARMISPGRQHKDGKYWDKYSSYW